MNTKTIYHHCPRAKSSSGSPSLRWYPNPGKHRKKHIYRTLRGIGQNLGATVVVDLWSGCAPKSTETQKELKWPKSDSKVTPRAPAPEWPQVTQKWLKNDSKMGSRVTFESILGHFGVGLPESLLGHFNSFCVSVDLGARWLHNGRYFCLHA